MLTKSQRKAAWTESKATHVQHAFKIVGDRYQVSGLENDHNAGLPGTEEYDGRAVAFTVKDGRRSYRITVEDITLDEDDPSMVEKGDDWPTGDVVAEGILQTVADRNDGDPTAGITWARSLGFDAFYKLVHDVSGDVDGYFYALAKGADLDGVNYDKEVGPAVDRVEDALIAYQDDNREPSDDSLYNR